MGKNLPINAGDVRDMVSIPDKIPWRKTWQPTPVFLPGESHGQRRLVSYSPWSCKELDTTEGPRIYTSSVCIHTSIHIYTCSVCLYASAHACMYIHVHM